MQIPNWLRPPKGIQWTPQLGATLALVVIAGAMAFSGIISLVLALFTFGANADLSTTLESAVKKHEQLAKVDRDRFDGRSVFFMPPAPVRNVPKPPPPPKIEKPLPPPAPIIPQDYGGKKPISVLGPTVYFEGFQIKLGEEYDGIKVLGTNAPWSVKLGYQGGEYDVTLWAKPNEDFFSGKWPTKSTPGIEISQTPLPGKGKSASGVGGNMATSGDANRGGPNSATANGALPPGVNPNPQPSTTKSEAEINKNQPARDGPDGAPLPNAPIRPPLPDGAPSANPATDKNDVNPSKVNGWNANAMASPAPLTQEEIGNMQLPQALASQATLLKSKGNTALDLANRERIDNELAQIAQRINELKGQSSPP